MKKTSEMGTTSKMKIKNYLKFYLMTSHHDSHTITDVKPEIIPGVQTRNGIPHDIHNICGMSVCVAWFPDYGHIVAGIFNTVIYLPKLTNLMG